MEKSYWMTSHYNEEILKKNEELWNQRQLVINLYLFTSLCRQKCLVTLKSWGQGSFWKLKSFSTKKVLPQIFINISSIFSNNGRRVSKHTVHSASHSLRCKHLLLNAAADNQDRWSGKGGWEDDEDLFKDRERHPKLIYIALCIRNVCYSIFY